MSLRINTEQLQAQTDLVKINEDAAGIRYGARSELTSTRLDNLNSTNLQILQTIERHSNQAVTT